MQSPSPSPSPLHTQELQPSPPPQLPTAPSPPQQRASPQSCASAHAHVDAGADDRDVAGTQGTLAKWQLPSSLEDAAAAAASPVATPTTRSFAEAKGRFGDTQSTPANAQETLAKTQGILANTQATLANAQGSPTIAEVDAEPLLVRRDRDGAES
eukprot:3827451-Pleurochrysis_carterae.AAC.1